VNAEAAGNNAPHGFTGFRIHLQRLVFHALLQLEPANRFRRVRGFVNVNRHGGIYSAARDCSFGCAAFSVDFVSDSIHSV
jgi:hypothetical protein